MSLWADHKMAIIRDLMIDTMTETVNSELAIHLQNYRLNGVSDRK
jgi:hypothetical protein